MLNYSNREELREQHDIVNEISEAISSSVGHSGIDESELDAELEELQQEELDGRMLATGQVPVADKVSPALPNAPQTGKSLCFSGMIRGLTAKQSRNH
jgi:charged multivesicular body protein 4